MVLKKFPHKKDLNQINKKTKYIKTFFSCAGLLRGDIQLDLLRPTNEIENFWQEDRLGSLQGEWPVGVDER